MRHYIGDIQMLQAPKTRSLESVLRYFRLDLVEIASLRYSFLGSIDPLDRCEEVANAVRKMLEVGEHPVAGE